MPLTSELVMCLSLLMSFPGNMCTACSILICYFVDILFCSIAFPLCFCPPLTSLPLISVLFLCSQIMNSCSSRLTTEVFAGANVAHVWSTRAHQSGVRGQAQCRDRVIINIFQ
jgi:hypothetical protein